MICYSIYEKIVIDLGKETIENPLICTARV